MSFKNDKKLLRGLQDISPLFTPSGISHGFPKQTSFIANIAENDHATHTSQMRENDKEEMISEHKSFPQAFCFAIQPFEASKQLLERPVFIEALKAIFGDVFYLSFSANRMNQMTSDGLLRHLILPPFQVYDILHPKQMVSGEPMPRIDEEKKACFFLEPKSVFEFRTDLFQLLDHIILHVSAKSSESIMAAYQILMACLHKDPSLSFSMLIDECENSDAAEMIYERFSRITSQFLGCEVDFLGWMDDKNVQLNQELLLTGERRSQFVKKPLKMQLMQLLAEEMLLEVV